MELIVFVLAAAVLAGGWWWFRGRSTTAPVEDVWELPPDAGAPVGRLPEASGAGTVLDRASLLNRNRVLDPQAWDNTPDPEGASDEDEGADDDWGHDPDALPRHFSRDDLLRRSGEPPSP